MQRNTKIIASMGLIPEPRELHAICRGGTFLDDIKGIPLNGPYRVFKAILDTDGAIIFSGHTRRDGFPSYALAMARNLAEGKQLLDPFKPTGGWPYWHYFDEISGEWENLSHLWERTLNLIESDGRHIEPLNN